MELSPELRPYIEEAERSVLKDKMIVKFARPLITSGEVKPQDIVPVIATSRNGTKSAFPMMFGFRAPTGALVLNARSESASQKPMFKDAWSHRRCIIPASWYYEWQHFSGSGGAKKTGDKYLFQTAGSSVTWICGLYRIEDGIPFFVILTRDAPEEIRSIHDRMPLILPSGAVDSWIDPYKKPDELLNTAVTDLIYAKAQ